ncbi:3'-5' exonuclease [Lacticaseibacillus suibinensis]|uniref:3'-5' exonuclease n=1 Tax=Lacticaseibacillus suibinensis TaxID=2486011 RepID=UPI0013DDFF28|nr:3'-5' exonuclease [Lacticaseibacillus suibinensis]
MNQAAVIKKVQAPLAEEDWLSGLQAALTALAAFSGGTPEQAAATWDETTGLMVNLACLWPNAVPALPALNAMACLPTAPKPKQAADRVLRRLLNAYTLSLRDPTALPPVLVADWPAVRQVYNQIAAVQAVMHQWRLEPEAPNVQTTLYGPVAGSTKKLLTAAGVKASFEPMAQPWATGFQGAAMAPVVVGEKSRDGRAGVGQQQEVLDRAKALQLRHFPRTKRPAFVRQEQPTLYHEGSVRDYTVFDLEFSSGNVHEGMFITEIGAVKVRAGQIVDTFNAFVKVPAKHRLNVYSQRVTGIHEATLKTYGLPADQAARQFIDFIGSDVLLGFSMHGGDLPVLRRQFGLYPTAGRLIDVAQLAKRVGPMPGTPEVSLTRYRHYLGLSLLAHGALYDAVTTHALYAYLEGHPVAPDALVAEFEQVFARSLKGALPHGQN